MSKNCFAEARNRRKNLVPLFPAIIVTSWAYYISSSPTAIAIALSAGLVAFCVCKLAIDNTQDTEPKPDANPSVPSRTLDVAILLLYSSIILTLIFTPPEPALLQSDWLVIPAMEWVRFMFSILITMFLPGYAILRLLDGKRQIRGLMLVPVSYVLALCFTVVLALPFGGSVTSTNSLVILNVIAISFLGFRIVMKERPRCVMTGGDSPRILGHYRFAQETLIITSILGFVFVAVFTVYFVNPWLRGDMWRHFADATFVMKYGLADRGYYYPWFNAVLWSQIFGVSGFPAVNAVLIIVSLLFPISIFAFYSTVRSLTKSSVLPGLSTAFWATFAGFDWLGTLNFHEFGSLQTAALTYESGIFSQPGFFGFDHPPFLVGIVCLLILVTLFTDTDLSSRTRIPLISLILYVGYMIDVEVMVIFLIGFLPFIAIKRNKNRFAVSPQSILALLVGLAMVATTDWVSPAPVKFYLNDTYLVVWVIGVSALFFLLTTRPKLDNILKSLRFHPLQPPGWRFRLGAFYAYVASFIILFVAIPYLPWRPFFTNIPAYQYTFRLGVAGVLALTLLLIPATTKVRSMIGSNLRLLGWIVLGILVEAEISGWLALFDQTRFFYPAFVLFCILAAAGLARICGHFVLNHQIRIFSTRALAVTALVSLVMISGISSTLLSVNMWTKATGPWADTISPTAEERAGIDFLRNLSTPTAFTIATPALHWWSYDNQLLGLSGARILYDDQLSLLFGTKDPATSWRVLELQGVKYIWISQSRLESSFNSSYVISHLVPNLRPIFEGSDIRIYEVPSFHSPFGNDVAVSVESNYLSQEEYFVPEMVGLSGVSYGIFATNDYSQLQFQTIVLTSDSSYAGWLDSNFTSWTPTFGSVVRSNDIVTYSTPNDTNPYYDYASPALRINTTRQPYLLVNWRMPLIMAGFTGLSLFIHGSITGFHYLDLGYSNAWTSSRFDLRDFSSFGTAASGRVPITHDMIRSDEIVDLVILRTGDKGASYQLRSIGIVDNPSIPSFNATELALAGKEVVVVNTYGYGSVAHLMGFQPDRRVKPIDSFRTSSMTISVPESELTFWGEPTNATVLLSYSFMGRIVAPLAYEKHWGNGEIIYLDLKPYFDSVGAQSQGQNRYDSFNALKIIPSLIGLNQPSADAYLAPKTPPLGFVETVDHIAFSYAQFAGSLVINSTFLQVTSESKADTLTLDSVAVNGFDGGLYVRNLVINGTKEILIISSEAQLRTDTVNGGYSIITADTSTTITIRALNLITLDIGADNTGARDTSVHAKLASITYSEPVTFRVRNPVITIEGVSHYVNAWSDVLNGKTFLARGGNVTIGGNSKLGVESTSPNMQAGSVQLSQQTFARGDSQGSLYSTSYLYSAVPWIEIAKSPWNIALVGLIGLVWFGRSKLFREVNRTPK